MEKLVLAREAAADKLGVSARTLDRWRYEGRGPLFCKLGARVGYLESDLLAFVEASRRTSTSAALPPAA